MELEKSYNYKTTESRIYELWESSGCFNPDKQPNIDAKKGNYVVMIAPPNITGSLHMGHALENTISDILVRYHRMSGFKTLWVPGTDHAGISTQSVVEKDLAKKGISKHDLGREEFIKKIWEWREKYGSLILNQLKRLGCSLDWSRTAFTMDAGYKEAVKYVFEYYLKKGWIYKGKRVINWSVKDQTSLSDLEIYYKEHKDSLWYIKYPIAGRPDEFITVATTRPETMLGDTAVAVNPDDERYKKFAGQKAVVPLVNREVPIISDAAVDLKFGTGAVKVTPAHDIADFEIGQRHNLQAVEVINTLGKVNEAFPEFKGLKVTDARKKIVEKLKELGLIEKEEEYTHNVAYGERCHTIIEPMLSNQWFLNMKELAKMAIDAVESGEVKYHPEKWKDMALTWLKNIKDWNISRQIWWGHPVPVDPEGNKISNGAGGSTDVLDTWFSSALWPFASLGWPNPTDDFEKYYPTNVITSARDILHLWISRMIYSGLEFTGKVPFKDVLIHETILAKDGKRMSKSLGTGLDPMDFIEKYGADAVRFGLIYQSLGCQDIKFGEEFIVTGGRFANKLWNIARFIMMKIGPDYVFRKYESFEDLRNQNPGLAEKYAKELARINELSMAVSKGLGEYKFGETLHELYRYAWHELADKLIEETKSKDDEVTKDMLTYILQTILRLLHPFMPFVTEEIYSHLPIPDKSMLLVEHWPEK
ncbi:MAG: valyl-tRNA synthetase [Parcubacteria group bacterium Licking1014_17]|nr:MAG: valyl-tRNA synthetase [Parcubacteria group bacterium Licking1014_17]